MNKIKKNLLSFFGAFIAFIFSYSWVFSQKDLNSNLEFMSQMDIAMYGVQPEPTLTLWEKTISVIFSPFILITAFILAFIVGTIIFIKRKKNNKKNTN